MAPFRRGGVIYLFVVDFTVRDANVERNEVALAFLS